MNALIKSVINQETSEWGDLKEQYQLCHFEISLLFSMLYNYYSGKIPYLKIFNLFLAFTKLMLGI